MKKVPNEGVVLAEVTQEKLVRSWDTTLHGAPSTSAVMLP